MRLFDQHVDFFGISCEIFEPFAIFGILTWWVEQRSFDSLTVVVVVVVVEHLDSTVVVAVVVDLSLLLLLQWLRPVLHSCCVAACFFETTISSHFLLLLFNYSQFLLHLSCLDSVVLLLLEYRL